MLRMTPKSRRLEDYLHFLGGGVVVCKSIKKRWKYMYFLFMGPFVTGQIHGDTIHIPCAHGRLYGQSDPKVTPK